MKEERESDGPSAAEGPWNYYTLQSLLTKVVIIIYFIIELSVHSSHSLVM
jgi:hypothetical protein